MKDTQSRRIVAGLFAAATLCLDAPAAFADVKAGVDAWSAGDYKAAVKQWQATADQGDPDAQFNLAQAYKLGRGVDQDLAKAESYYQLAAARGHLQAADNYGLLLFQRGERTKAMPFIAAAADRGDPRAQYVLGLAHFNGDNAARDWTRAYALVSLAHQAGLPQAAGALKQMDEFIPLAQRQESVPLAAEIKVRANTLRASQVAARDLGTPQQTAQAAASPAGGSQRSGADYTLPETPPAIAKVSPKGWIEVPPPTPAPALPQQEAKPVRIAKPTPAPKPAPLPKPAPAPAIAAAGGEQGPWRAQLGAFGVPGNADRLWAQVASRAELAGRRKLLVPAGRLTKLQAGEFASQADASAACNRLKAAGFACLPVKD